MTRAANADHEIEYAKDVIYSTYGDVVSVQQKKKNLLKFGRRVTVGTSWETLTTAIGSEVAETLPSDNVIDSIISSSASDTGTVNIEYHTISGGETTFGVQSATLNGTTRVALATPAYRTSRVYNTGSSALVGNVYTYQDNTGRDDNKTFATISAGENQSQKAATTISGTDYWIITSISISVLSKATKYAEARLESKPVATSYWRPISQTIGCTDSSGTVELSKRPFIIVPSNYDVRLAVQTNTSAVIVSGGFNGYLATVIS